MGQVTILLQDINERPSYSPGVKFTVPENSIFKTKVGAPVTASDQDLGQSYDYALVGGGDNFDVNPSTGQIFVKAGAKLDYEGPIITYQMFIQSSDDGVPKLKSMVSVEVTLTDVNESPRFKEGIVVSIPENSEVLASAGLPLSKDVSDPDAGATFKYSSTKINVEVRSEACDDPGKTSGCGISTIIVDGEQVSRKQRGHNVVVMDEVTGKVLDSQAFDTYGSSKAGHAFNNYLDAIENGRVVVVATQDSADKHSKWSDAAMRSIGAGPTQTGEFRSSLAMIGQKGIFGPSKVGTAQRIIIQDVPMFQDGRKELNKIYQGSTLKTLLDAVDVKEKDQVKCKADYSEYLCGATLTDAGDVIAEAAIEIVVGSTCGKACEDNPSCVAWVFRYNKCTLKSSVSKVIDDADVHNTIAGYSRKAVDGPQCLRAEPGASGTASVYLA